MSNLLSHTGGPTIRGSASGRDDILAKLSEVMHLIICGHYLWLIIGPPHSGTVEAAFQFEYTPNTDYGDSPYLPQIVYNFVPNLL